MLTRYFLILAILASQIGTAEAGIFFNRKKEKVDPKTRIPELVSTLRTDRDADKRARAAEELRNFDPAQYPDIIPVLIETLQKDNHTYVRVEAAQTLGRLRPVSQQVGEALEQALSVDTSMRVRLQARSSLLQYHWAGYRSAKKSDTPPPLTTNNEPPLAGSNKNPPVINTTIPPGTLRPVPSNAPIINRPALTPAIPSTKEPPLAPSAAPALPTGSAVPIVPRTTGPIPLPMGPSGQVNAGEGPALP